MVSGLWRFGVLALTLHAHSERRRFAPSLLVGAQDLAARHGALLLVRPALGLTSRPSLTRSSPPLTHHSHLLSLSLALAFFNLLPLPALDGSQILTAYLTSIASTSDRNLEEGLGILVPPPPGLLESALDKAREVRWLARLADAEQVVGARLRLWTWAVGGVLVVATLAVEVMSAHK